MLSSLSFRSKHTSQLEPMPAQMQSAIEQTYENLRSPSYRADQEDFTRVEKTLEALEAMKVQLLQTQGLLKKSSQVVSPACFNAIKNIVNTNLPEKFVNRINSCEPLFGNDHRSEYQLAINFLDNKLPRYGAYPEIEVRLNFRNIPSELFPKPLVLKLNFAGKPTINVAEPSDYFLSEKHKQILEKIIITEANLPERQSKRQSTHSLDNDVQKLSNSLIDKIPSLYCFDGYLNIGADKYDLKIARLMNEDSLIIKMIKSGDIQKQCRVLLEKNKEAKIIGEFPSQDLYNPVIQRCLELYRNTYEFKDAPLRKVELSQQAQNAINVINNKLGVGKRIDLEKNNITLYGKRISGEIHKHAEGVISVRMHSDDKIILLYPGENSYIIKAAHFEAKDQQNVEELLHYFGDLLSQ